MIYKLVHRTTYSYKSPVSVADHIACLKPRTFKNNKLLSNEIRITPTPTTLTERQDYFGNTLSFFSVHEPHRELIVEATSMVATSDAVLPGDPSLPWEESTQTVASHGMSESLEAHQFQFESPRIRLRPEFAAYALQSFTPRRPMAEALFELTARIHSDFRFDAKVTTVRTTIEEVFEKRHGVCQDFAHLQIACLRSIHLASRYVSGYLRTYPPQGKPRLVGADASHAWVSVWCRGVGWLDVDPTNNLVPSDGHVTLAWGRDYGDVSPLRGLILGGGSHTLDVAVDMEPVGE
jgi:transglutaminase-like putative cysteine protease